MTNLPNIVMAICAFILTVIGVWKFYLSHKKQKMNESGYKSHGVVSSPSPHGAKVEAKIADLKAAFVQTGRIQYKLHIWNQGNATARNVRFEYEPSGGIFIASEVNEKFPLDIEALGDDYPVKLIAARTLGSDLKHPITLTWDDDSGDNHKKQITVSF